MPQSWLFWPDNAALSVLVLLLIVIPFLYAARKPMHGIIRSLTRAITQPMRLGARWLSLTARELRQRNKVVLLAHGREEVGQLVEREFERVGMLVRRDLQGYPALQRKLLDEITRVEEDYHKCGEVPPPPPDWIEAVAAMAKVKSNGNEMVQRVLEEIKRSVDKIHDKALNEYRRAYEQRHRILKGFMPFWRSLDKTLAQVDKKLTGMEKSAAVIDAQMEKYEQINAKTDKVEQALTTSAMIQFVIAALVMFVALGGAFINFKLIALPMSEMVGSSDYITDSLRTSEVAALVIIFLEASMGLFLMESLRVTHLFPRIANMDDRMRRRMLWASLVFLLILAGVEAALALMRDMLIADKQALLQSLSTAQVQSHADGWFARIPTAGQMILGFVLPFALSFVAIPLETFIHSLRTVVGVGLVILLRSIAFVLRFIGAVARQLGTTLIMVYDVVIFAPLMIERLVQSVRGRPVDGREEKLGRNYERAR
jgi:hypothetical protein